MTAHCADAVSKGARVLAGGGKPAELPEKVAGGNFFEPTVLADATIDMWVGLGSVGFGWCRLGLGWCRFGCRFVEAGGGSWGLGSTLTPLLNNGMNSNPPATGAASARRPSAP